MQGEPVKKAEIDLAVDEAVRAAEREFDLRVQQVLERVPEVDVAGDFAARVAARAMTEVPARRTLAARLPGETRFGTAAVWIGLVVLLAVMVVLAPKATGGGGFWVAMEWMLCAQFVGLAVWASAGTWRRE